MLRNMDRSWKAVGLCLIILLIVSMDFLRWHVKPRYVRNFEMEVYGAGNKYLEPVSVVDGLAVYQVGSGEPVLLLPYPHGHTVEPMAQGPIADILVALGRSVISFDPPGAYRSTREPLGTMEEMLAAADETLAHLEITGPVDVVGHSMSGFVALAYAVERPHRVQRLVLANSVSGFPAAARCGYPGSAFGIWEPDYWRIIRWGLQVNGGRASLATHKQLQNLMQEHAFFDRSFFTPLAINAADFDMGVPIRMIWSKNMYTGLSYADRLVEIHAPTLVISSRHDPEAGIQCSDELVAGIPNADQIIFERSGHAPFIEERRAFQETLAAFLGPEMP